MDNDFFFICIMTTCITLIAWTNIVFFLMIFILIVIFLLSCDNEFEIKIYFILGSS